MTTVVVKNLIPKMIKLADLGWRGGCLGGLGGCLGGLGTGAYLSYTDKSYVEDDPIYQFVACTSSTLACSTIGAVGGSVIGGLFPITIPIGLTVLGRYCQHRCRSK